MRLIKLELNGFKSFAKKTQIDIERGVTAIIGPNGSGKSNIADAVRWVLGEQSAKALRGAKMEDVIFNGTESRKPQAFCEVTLTFDNADGELPTDYAEVSITRRVYRSGESEYLINRTPCRLKDIQSLLRDTGVGKEGYSIIGQGKVEEILSNKSGDRRAAFEEAAGVMKYRVRKEEAERKLENTKKNLVRLQDILEELGTQIGPLEEQSEAARTFLRLRDELREIEVNLFLYQYDKLQERLKALEESLGQLDGELRTAGELAERLSKQCAQEEEQERELNGAISDMQGRLLSMSSGAEAHAGSVKVLEERMGNLSREQARLEEESRSQSSQAAVLRAQWTAAGQEQAAAQEARDACAADLAQTERARQEMEQEIQQREQETERQKNSMIEALNRLSDAKSRISRLEAIRTAVTERMGEAQAQEQAIRQEGEKLEQEQAQLAACYSQMQAAYQEKHEARQAAAGRVSRLQTAIKAVQEESRRMEQQAEAAKSRIKVLEEMKRAYEGYYASVRNLLKDADRDQELGACIEGVVAELVQVPKAYETALEMALGSAMQNIVTPTDQAAKKAIDHLRSRQYGRATFLPVNVIRPRTLNQQELSCCQVKGFLGVASQLVGYAERYRGIFENLLGRTVLVEDLEAGMAINRQAKGAFRIATLKGDIINPGGSMTGGSTQKREFSLIGREREIQELQKGLAQLAKAIREQASHTGEMERELAAAEQGLQAATEALHAQDLELAAQREKVEALKQYVEENQEALERNQREYSQLQDNIDNIDQQCAEARQAQSSLEAGNVASQEDVRRMQAELTARRSEYAGVNDKATEQKVALMAREKELQGLQQTRERLEKEAKSLEQQAAAAKEQAAQSQRQQQLLQAELATLLQGLDGERKDIDLLTEQIRSLEEERASHLRALDEARGQREEAAQALSELGERRHKVELNQNRAQMELANMQDRIWNDYELTYENAQPMRREISVAAGNIRADALKKEIKALGDVNINAIEDYRNVKDRYDALDAQCKDLTQAEADLQVLIEDLVHTMEREFQRQFSLIQQNFSIVFGELFGGGRAELVLSDPKDILNCDIDIIAQPPGKKLQLLSLLSGGERALTAIALLFAILKLKPTAFCILDEIEAALDEANVSNFASYVRNYSANTQFILITHRKGSMEVCDSLYGVAMEEKGVSKVVSARFASVGG